MRASRSQPERDTTEDGTVEREREADRSDEGDRELQRPAFVFRGVYQDNEQRAPRENVAGLVPGDWLLVSKVGLFHDYAERWGDDDDRRFGDRRPLRLKLGLDLPRLEIPAGRSLPRWKVVASWSWVKRFIEGQCAVETDSIDSMPWEA